MSLTGAQHLAHRRPLNLRFRPRAVTQYREGLLRATAARYIDAIAGRGKADANADILEPITLRAVGDVMGFTDVDDATLRRWFHGYAAYLVDFGRSGEVAGHGRLIKAEVAAEKLTTSGITLGGVGIPAGTEIALILGSANRDEGRHADPDTFDLDRPRQGHVSFGFGMHFCVGHFVARQLEQVMIEEMFTRLPGLRRDPDREPTVHGWAVRAAKRLPVVWDA